MSKRLMKEIPQVTDKTMRDMGIYYIPDTASITKGKVLIQGPDDSPFEGCFFIFQFAFPDDYPFSPPKVNVLTTDGLTRFHPNLYVEGKVCLSILGTYTGPSWQSTMSLSMVLLSLKALLDTNPLSHEPGYSSYTLANPLASTYASFVQHQLVALTLSELRGSECYKGVQDDLPDDFKEKTLVSLKKVIMKNLEYSDTLYTEIPYGMRGCTRWKVLHKEVLLLEKNGNAQNND
uniref:Ubiquitin-conjugating enzyme E2 Z n=1 Tax=viral metagenome TaxID=1070528 RepID=A0A6C0BK94_9ZZZZ